MNAQKQRTERTDNDRNSNGEASKHEKKNANRIYT